MPNAARIAAAAFAMRNLWSGKTGGPVQVVSAPADVVARGKYLAEAADCAACHTAPGARHGVLHNFASAEALLVNTIVRCPRTGPGCRRSLAPFGFGVGP
jgi:mono/diheme cytochrome c family protein